MTDNPGGKQIRGVLSTNRKLLLSSEEGFERGGWDRASAEFYDLEGDSREANNRKGEQLSALRTATEDYFESSAITRQEIDAVTRRALKALGYVQ